MSLIDFQANIEQSPLSFFQTDVPQITPNKSYDYAFEIDGVIIFVLTDSQHIAVNLQDYASQRHTAYVELARHLLKRHQKLCQAMPVFCGDLFEQVAQQNPDKYDDKNLPPVYFIGLTAVSTTVEEVNYSLDYQLGGAFFYDECVFDLDDESTLIQVFSLSDWQQLLDTLPSPSDLLVFLKYHRQNLLQQVRFESVQALAWAFMHDAAFFQRAWLAEKHLQKHNLIARIDPLLKESIYKKQDSIALLVERQRALSPLWVQLVKRLIERQQNAGASVNWWVVRTLLLQSGYTRMKIVEFVLAQKNATFGQKQEGVVCHEHSHHKFGQHFTLVVYGQHPDSDLHAQKIYATHKSILHTLDAQMQDEALQGLFLLGFDLSHSDSDGNIQVMMDVYYQPSRFAGSV